MNGPCAKGVVTATLVAVDGRRFVGTNDCRRPQDTCPRGDMPSGIGYDLCRDVCDQTAHAEVNACRAAGVDAAGGVLYVEGHTYACPGCVTVAMEYGVVDVVIGAPPEVTP